MSLLCGLFLGSPGQLRVDEKEEEEEKKEEEEEIKKQTEDPQWIHE